MKKLIAFLIMAAMLAVMAGCGAKPAADENVGGVDTQQSAEETQQEEETTQQETEETQQAVTDEEKQAIMDVLGFSEEEFAAMDPEQQKVLALEIGAVLEQQAQQQQQQAEAKTYTPDDVMAGGSYRVVLGDYMNSITLYYKDGKLVKLVESFQKSDEEETMDYVAEGAALQEYGFNFIDWDMATLQEIIDGMKDYGAFGEYRIYAE